MRQIPADVDGVALMAFLQGTSTFFSAYEKVEPDLTRHVVMSAYPLALGERPVGVVASHVLPLASTAPSWVGYLREFEDAFPAMRGQGGNADDVFSYDSVQAALQAIERVHGDISGGERRFQVALAASPGANSSGTVRLDRNRQAIGPGFLVRVERAGAPEPHRARCASSRTSRRRSTGTSRRPRLRTAGPNPYAARGIRRPGPDDEDLGPHCCQAAYGPGFEGRVGDGHRRSEESRTMSSSSSTVELFVASYGSEPEAGAALKAFQSAQRDGAIDLIDAAVIVHTADGKVRFEETADPSGKKWAKRGAIAGGVVGLIFPPSIIVSAAVGGGAGGIWGKVRDKGFKDEDLKEIGESLPPGTSAIIVIAEDRMVAQLERGLEGYNKIAKHVVSADAAAAIIAEVDEDAPAE